MNIGSVKWTATCYALLAGGVTLVYVSFRVLVNEIKECIR